jgi:hypothetical protein
MLIRIKCCFCQSNHLVKEFFSVITTGHSFMKPRIIPILIGTQFAWVDGSYRKVREKATVLENVAYLGWARVMVKVAKGKRGG